MGLATERLRYPALRLRPLTQRAPADALAELGYAAGELAGLEEEYDRVAAELFADLRARAAEVGAEHLVERLRPDLPGHASKRLVYLAVRLQRPEAVVETGTLHGTISAFVLRALAENGRGHLQSFDLPAYEPLREAPSIVLPADCEPGWLIPEELRDRLQLTLGDTRATLPAALRGEQIDIFVHDSRHTLRHMLFEFRQAWRALVPGGLLISDDVFDNGAFWWFTRTRRVPFLHIGNMGVTGKPRRS